MPECKKLKRKKRQYCIGDMNERITLENRNIAPPVYGSVDFGETFTTKADVWAGINTVTVGGSGGKTIFDDTGTEIDVTHIVTIRYDATVTDETWVLWGTKRLDILTFENLDGRDEFMQLNCTDRGLSTNAASNA